MRDNINFKVKDIMDKLTTEELVFELQKRKEEKELIQIAFQYILEKIGYDHFRVETLCKQLKEGTEDGEFRKASN